MISRATHELFLEIISGEKKGPVPAFARAGLWLLSKPYSIAVTLRNSLYLGGILRRHSIHAPVVSVGNLTLGGSGKTPLVEWLVKWFRARGKKPAIISRGYGRPRHSPRHKHLSDVLEIRDDEQFMISRKMPQVIHVADKDRVAAATRAIDENHARVIILDDGFQHLRIRRDLDIVVIDCLNPFGYGHLFPRGLMREPQRALARAHVAVLSHTGTVSPFLISDIERHLETRFPGLATVRSDHHALYFLDSRDDSRFSIDEMRGKPVLAFSGIGNPLSFELTLAETRVKTLHSERFPDHYYYTPAELSSLAEHARRLGAEALVTTEKDLVRIPTPDTLSIPLYGLAIQLEITAGLEILERFLNRFVRG